MSAHDNSGPAFPYNFPPDNPFGGEGMSLRDWFAATLPMDVSGVEYETMETLLGEKRPADQLGQLAWAFRCVAVLRYMQADAFIAERAKAEGQS